MEPGLSYRLWITKRKWLRNAKINHERKHCEVTNWIKIAQGGILKGAIQFSSIVSEN
jgi:hypothetical protein